MEDNEPAKLKSPETDPNTPAKVSEDSLPATDTAIRLHIPFQPISKIAYTPMLICFEGPDRGRRFMIDVAQNSLGRSSRCHIRLQDELASRAHASISYDNIGMPDEVPVCFIEDVGSRNGTELNGKPLLTRRKLHERDRVTIGTTVLGFFLRDDGELEMEQTLLQLATRDSLTGLQNRHSFQTAYAHNYQRARKYERHMSLVIVDIDDFKKVNDQHGHDIGDLALAHVARIIVDSSRSTELCARWGGDEFVVLLPEGDGRAATMLSERIRSTVEASPLRTSEKEVPLTVSVGCAELMPDELSEDLFRRADQQLLRAKEQGRNLVFFDFCANLTTEIDTSS